ncbi:hypothetical protein [Bacillus sp. AK128]
MDLFIFGVMFLLLLIVIGIYLANNKIEKILIELKFGSVQKGKYIELLKEIKEELQKK